MFKRILSILLIAALVAPAPLFAETLSRKTLQSDIAYYHKVTREKKLDANGRYYILLRIEEKYRGSKVNLSPLREEMRKLKKKSGPAASRGKGKSAVSEPACGTLEKLTFDASGSTEKITIVAPGATGSNYFLLKDPEPGELTKLVLDLYNTVYALPDSEKAIETNSGTFARVRAGQFKEKPGPIVRVVAELREARPYRILRDKNTWTITVNKETAEEKNDIVLASMPAAPPPVQKPGAPPPAEIRQVQPAEESAPAISTEAPGKHAEQGTTGGEEAVAGYVIDTGDVLGITVFPADELSREAIVQADGNIPFPLIGRAKAKGFTPKQLEEQLAKSLSRYVSHPTVNVSVKQFSKRQLFITGEVRSVGTYPYKNNPRLLEFISSLGGFTDNANRKEIKVYRGEADKRQSYTVDLEEVIRSGNFAKDFPLEPGDIIEVPSGRSRIAVLGDVRNPGYYDFRDNLHLVELISLAGGFTDTANLKDVRVLHPGEDKSQAVTKVNLKNILSGSQQDIPVQSGDTVYVPKGSMASANWFVNNILPWLSLVSLVLVIRGGV